MADFCPVYVVAANALLVNINARDGLQEAYSGGTGIVSVHLSNVRFASDDFASEGNAITPPLPLTRKQTEMPVIVT